MATKTLKLLGSKTTENRLRIGRGSYKGNTTVLLVKELSRRVRRQLK